jgi:UDP-N-acetylmuramoyl-tripeptide--D-alanyl-D-alanine ligase
MILNYYRTACYLVIILLIAIVCSGLNLKSQESSNSYKKLNTDEFKVWMKDYYKQLLWIEHEFDNKLTKDILLKSYNLGKNYIINNQKPEGNFNYEYDFVTDKLAEIDSQARQAGAVWALVLMYGFDQDDNTKKALDKGLDFFLKHTITGSIEGNLVIAYPGDQTSSTNTVALISLALIDYLSLDKKGIIKLSSQYKQRLNKYLNGYLNHLKSIHLDNKHFSRYYYYKNKTYVQEYDPYADGETLLALIKAAKYLGHAELIPIIEQSAIVMAKHYTYDQWINNYDSPKTKGFFQWSCMAFWEYQDAGWKDSEFYRQYVLSLAWWMINIHKTLYRKANTAYVYEGIIPALLIARDMKRKDVVSDLEYTIDRALYKLTSWQVGGPLQAENFFMLNTPIKNKNAIGGIMNYKNRPVLRIDVTQHQMHVVIWALRHVYR